LQGTPEAVHSHEFTHCGIAAPRGGRRTRGSYSPSTAPLPSRSTYRFPSGSVRDFDSLGSLSVRSRACLSIRQSPGSTRHRLGQRAGQRSPTHRERA
jgi:hypothetical protein